LNILKHAIYEKKELLGLAKTNKQTDGIYLQQLAHHERAKQYQPAVTVKQQLRKITMTTFSKYQHCGSPQIAKPLVKLMSAFQNLSKETCLKRH